MVFRLPVALAAVLPLAIISCGTPQSSIQRAMNQGTGVITLPDGVTELQTELRIQPNSRSIQIVGGKGSVLRLTKDFQGRAALMIHNATGVKLRNFRIEGNRSELEKPADVPPASSPFLNHFLHSGILVDESKDVQISDVTMREVAGFAVLASRVKQIKIERLTVDDSGGRNLTGRNNSTGGVLFEEGTDDFEIRDSIFRKILGSAVWTHSTYLSARNYRGVIANNRMELIGREAIHVGEANRVRVEGNTGRMIGYPTGVVDVEGRMIPAAMGTSGKVDEGFFVNNKFEEINGRCFNLDGFHDGEITGNSCVNRGGPGEYPHGQYAVMMNNSNKDMQSQLITIRDNVFDGTRYGGILVIGQGHKIVGNKLLNLNKGRCNIGLPPDLPCAKIPGEPTMTEAGIFLASRGERSAPADGNLIEGNEITGFNMSKNCVLIAPSLVGVENTIRGNKCSDQ